MAAGRTSRWRTKGPRSGLCVVINGNLKQRELTISFFISSPMLSAPTRATHTVAHCANTRTYTGTHMRAQSSGMHRSHLGYHVSLWKKLNAGAGGKKLRAAPRDPRGSVPPCYPLRGSAKGMARMVVALSSGYSASREAVKQSASQPSNQRNIKRYVSRNSITIRRYSLARERAPARGRSLARVCTLARSLAGQRG